MKDRKRLEHIKTKTLWYEADEYGNAELNVQAIYNDMIWLIEQAERAQELGSSYKRTIKKQHTQIVDLMKQNKRYREALTYVLKTHIEQYHDPKNMLDDIKFVVNEALEVQHE